MNNRLSIYKPQTMEFHQIDFPMCDTTELSTTLNNFDLNLHSLDRSLTRQAADIVDPWSYLNATNVSAVNNFELDSHPLDRSLTRQDTLIVDPWSALNATNEVNININQFLPPIPLIRHAADRIEPWPVVEVVDAPTRYSINISHSDDMDIDYK